MYPRSVGIISHDTPAPAMKQHGHSHDASQMNMRGVFLHVLSDALGKDNRNSTLNSIEILLTIRKFSGSVIVVCSALIVWLTEWEYKLYLDPALSVILVILILHSVWPLLRESALILLQTVPTHIQVCRRTYFDQS